MKFRSFALIHILLSLACGLSIYVLFREKTYLHQIFSFPWESIHSHLVFFGDAFLRYYLPDFLWGYALTFTLYLIYSPSKKEASPLPALASFAVGTCYEVAQELKILPGTGDVADIFLYLSAALAAYGIIINHLKRRTKQ